MCIFQLLLSQEDYVSFNRNTRGSNTRTHTHTHITDSYIQVKVIIIDVYNYLTFIYLIKTCGFYTTTTTTNNNNFFSFSFFLLPSLCIIGFCSLFGQTNQSFCFFLGKFSFFFSLHGTPSRKENSSLRAFNGKKHIEIELL